MDENGAFLADPSLFQKTMPQVETIMREVAAQLDYLTKLGFDIRYLDSHMFPEMYVKGMDEAMKEFAREKGLVDHMYFYRLPEGLSDMGNNADDPASIMKMLEKLPGGQYFFVTHPSLDTEEMRMTGNRSISGTEVAKSRARETALFSDPQVCERLRRIGCGSVRYDEAVPGKRKTVEEIRRMLGK